MRNTFDRFNGRHQDYQAARPSYAQEFLDWLGELYAPPERYTAADIGSGTGKLSAQLLAAGFRVCGVEPNPDMRGAAEALLGGDPRFSSSNGTDHDTGLPDRSVDMVAAAQAFHWFDGPAFARECRPDPASRRAGRSRLERPRVCTDEPGLGPGLSGALSELHGFTAGWGRTTPHPGFFRRGV